jgi:hypothetical protein
MSDIVDRLRLTNADFLHEEAADEIVRLREALRDCVETWRPLLADADLTAHENPAYLTLMRADLVLGEDRRT